MLLTLLMYKNNNDNKYGTNKKSMELVYGYNFKFWE